MLIPCSFPVRSLFRFSSRSPACLANPSLIGTYRQTVSTQSAIFPVFFPVSREFGARGEVRSGLRPPPLSHHSVLSDNQKPRITAFSAQNGHIHAVRCDPENLPTRMLEHFRQGFSQSLLGSPLSRSRGLPGRPRRHSELILPCPGFFTNLHISGQIRANESRIPSKGNHEFEFCLVRQPVWPIGFSAAASSVCTEFGP